MTLAVSDILIPSLICIAIAAVCGIILTLTSSLFGIKEDEKFTKVRDCLPGANCGACGYSGCDGYAKALCEGKTDATNLCVPGGDKSSIDIAEVLGVEAADVEEKIAHVNCNGTCSSVKYKFDYVGIKSCKIAHMSYGGDKACIYACLGYGDCVSVCPNNAIKIQNNVAKIISENCIGCGMCVRVCPSSVISLIRPIEKVAVTCNNHDKGVLTRKACTNGCISCGKCQKACPAGAITISHNLATIDYNKCNRCGACADACPIKCIHVIN